MTTLVAFLLDRTGSMENIKNDTIGSFNAYIGGLKSGDEDIQFVFSQFDSERGTSVSPRQSIKEVPLLTQETYYPRGGTNLIDAAYQTIQNISEFVQTQMTKPRVIICVQTDGEENASTKYTWEQLNSLVKAKQELGWQFNFMGAGIDAYKQANRMGIASIHTMSYNHLDEVATHNAFAATARNHGMYASGASASTEYSNKQRLDAGDAFATKLK
jgi:hypothetical protein